MIETVKFLEVEPRYNRATCLLINDDKSMFFGLAIKRERPELKKFYWCFYCSLDPKQYEYLHSSNAAESLSFLCISNHKIAVNKKVADRLLLEQPNHFAGIHLTFTQSESMDNERMILLLQTFCQEVQDRVSPLKEIKSHDQG